METNKVLYQIPDGYLINHLLKRRVSHEKRYIFHELNNMSLSKVMDYCYRCVETDGCY